MSVLIIPDIHLHYEKAEKIIDRIRADKIIFLGDSFHDWNDTPELNQKTAEWLKWSLDQPNRIHLVGNHEVPHIWSNNFYTWCSGFTENKKRAVDEVLNLNDWNKLKFHYILDNKWLITHAGLHPWFLPYKNFEISLKNIDKWLCKEENDAKIAGISGHSHWIFSAGQCRQGRMPYGGTLWLDYNKEFKCISNINQICGHTPLKSPVWMGINQDKIDFRHETYAPIYNELSLNICLDSKTHLDHFAFWSGKELSIEKY